MADVKVTSNGNVQIWAVPLVGIANINAPTAAEINAGVHLTPAIAWEGTDFPANEESNDVDDRSLFDKGNSTSRGFPQFGATLSFFRPVPGDTTSEAALAWNFFKIPRVNTILVVRVLQGTTGVYTVAAAGQWVSLYQMISSTVNDDTEGEDSYKYIVGFMPQGNLAVNTQVKNASPATLTPASTLSVTAAAGVNHSKSIRAVLGGKRATQVVTWTSSDSTKATVSSNGVVTGVAAGTASITANHPSASAASTAVVVTVT